MFPLGIDVISVWDSLPKHITSTSFPNMGKPRDKLYSKSKNRDTKKGDHSTKSLRTRKTDWSEQSAEGALDSFGQLCVSKSEDEEDNSRMILYTFIFKCFFDI